MSGVQIICMSIVGDSEVAAVSPVDVRMCSGVLMIRRTRDGDRDDWRENKKHFLHRVPWLSLVLSGIIKYREAKFVWNRQPMNVQAACIDYRCWRAWFLLN